MQSQKCPLCNADAEFFPTERSNRKHFLCKTCIEFEISRSAEKMLVKFSDEFHKQCSEKAKQSNSTHLFTITRASANDVASGSPQLNCEFALRDKL